MHDLLEGLQEPIHLLDHGFLRLVDAMPRLAEGGETADHAVVKAARVSYQGGTKTARGDRGLIRYLMRHHHTSPFEMVELKFHAKLPIFVARQWVRHRTASINEVSARYSVLPEEFYVPEPEHVRTQSTTNRQGGGSEHSSRAWFKLNARECMHGAFGAYRESVADNIARETARIVLPVATYTEWYWKANLLNVFRFLHLRMDSHAQYEIRVYAEAMATLVRRLAPWSFEAFEDYWRNAPRLSAQEWAAISEELTPEQRVRVRARLESQLSAGELREFDAKLPAAGEGGEGGEGGGA